MDDVFYQMDCCFYLLMVMTTRVYNSKCCTFLVKFYFIDMINVVANGSEFSEIGAINYSIRNDEITISMLTTFNKLVFHFCHEKGRKGKFQFEFEFTSSRSVSFLNKTQYFIHISTQIIIKIIHFNMNYTFIGTKLKNLWLLLF